MGHLTYLALLAGCLVVTAPLELVLRVRVYARWRRLLIAVVPELVVFVGWTLYAIAHGHWRYDAAQTLGLRFPGGLPVEEVLFFLVVPVCAVLTLEAVRRVTGWDAGYPAPDDSRGSIAARNERGADRGAESGREAWPDDSRGSIAARNERGADRGAESGREAWGA